MIIDTSAVIAILRVEPEARACADAIEAATERKMSAANYLEAAVVVDGARSPIASRNFDNLVRDARIEVVPVTERHAQIARAAYRDFGRGSGHPAKLDFGDCFAYALAADAEEPLLFKGNDFCHTDVRSALPD